MRSAQIIGAIVLFGVCNSAILAQTKLPAKYVVSASQVEVRSGPTMQFYPTSQLRSGDVVTVVGKSKQPGWLEIQPPPGSFSWINARFVKRIDDKSGHVASETPVGVMPGSSVTNRPPDVEKFQVKKGTVVAILDKPLYTDRGAFLPIQPAPNEVRYIPETAVRPATNTDVAKKAQANAKTSLLTQADKAMIDGHVQQAIDLYKRAAEQTQDFNVKSYAYQRLASLTRNASSPGHPANTGGVEPKLNQWGPAHTVARTTPGQTTAAYQPNTPAAVKWSPWGVLRRTAVPNQNGQPVYVLENQQGKPLLYVTTRPGLSLQRYIGETVALYGNLSYRSDGYLRTQFMVATHVARP